MEPRPELLADEPVRLPRGAEGDDGGPAAPLARRRRRRTWWAMVALVLVAGTVTWYTDEDIRSGETHAVAACERQLRRASDHADYRMGLTTNYVRPIDSGSARTHLADLMAPLARRVLPAVQRADRTCKAVTVRPWHFSLVARHHAATAYSGALVTLLQIVAAQSRGYFHDDATLQRLRDAIGAGVG